MSRATCQAGQRTRSKGTTGIAEFVLPCRCGQHVQAANGSWVRKGGKGATNAAPPERALQLPSGQRVTVAVEQGGDPNVLELRDEHGRGRAVLLPKPYWQTDKR